MIKDANTNRKGDMDTERKLKVGDTVKDSAGAYKKAFKLAQILKEDSGDQYFTIAPNGRHVWLRNLDLIKAATNFGGYGITLGCDGAVKDKGRAIFAKLTNDGEGWDVYANGCDGTKTIGSGQLSVTIATATDYNDATGFEIWLEARGAKTTRKQFRADDIDLAIAWIAKKERQIAAL